jgi:hypothetical protein
LEHDTILQQAAHDIQLQWSWCARCQRAYVTGTYRVVRFAADALHSHPAVLHLCPYIDCSASTNRHGWLWTTFQLEHSEYPVIPERNKMYAR